ncbi:Alkaline phosphatase synthesis sensor protein PhoR [compost metagenome]
MGIPPEHQTQVFERFYRVDGGRKGDGLGIGLAIVKEIIEAHQGDLTLNSLPHMETTFQIKLKRAADTQE